MQKVEVTTHLKKKYLSHFEGPILFTAPHSKRLNRGGKQYGEDIRIHQRQAITSYLAVYLAKETKLEEKTMNSFCVWGKSSVVDDADYDPNYLMDKNLHKSPFHCSLHAWAISQIKKQKIPKLFHIDIHGKYDRKHNCQVDVGIQSMIQHWKNQQQLIINMCTYFEKQFVNVFEGKQFGEFKCKFETSPYLHGYWGGGLRTMTQQAILLNIPSLQLQIPNAVRKRLFKEEQFRKNFAKGVVKFYNTIIVPWYDKSDADRTVMVSKQLAMKFQETIKSKKQSEEALIELCKMQQKSLLDLNKKVI